MSKPLISLVYPTRDRPAFVEAALKFLEQQRFDNFEVIISDNYSDPQYSCESIAKHSKIKNIRYVHPYTSLNMVENWNYAFAATSGRYVGYFTDKMFLLPGVLSRAASLIHERAPDIISWDFSPYTPNKFPDYFGPGQYFPAIADEKPKAYNPLKILSLKAQARVARQEQSTKDYARGKICFGLYSRTLIDTIIAASGKLFHDISPDYTSMILGLGLANNAFDLGISGIVHVNTDLSNGGQGTTNVDVAIRYLKSLNTPYETLLGNMLVPGLYSSQHNIVAHDYLTMRDLCALPVDLNLENWLLHIKHDLYSPDRQWFMEQIEREQKQLYWDWVEKHCSPKFLQYLQDEKPRPAPSEIATSPTVARRIIRKIIPQAWRTVIGNLLRHQSNSSHYIALNGIFEIIGISLDDPRT